MDYCERSDCPCGMQIVDCRHKRKGSTMNESNVVKYVVSQDSQRLVTDSCFQSSNPSTRYVSHADYIALGKRFAELTDDVAAGDFAVEQADRTIARLISKVTELREILKRTHRHFVPPRSKEEQALGSDIRNALREDK
jgi:hypothetical protein